MKYTRELYSKKWNESAKHFFDNCEYLWMCKQIDKYNTILEIGCGTGQSTLTLLENGHKVIAIEKNKFCIDKSKLLIQEKGYKIGSLQSNLSSCDVIFLHEDIFDDKFTDYINDFVFDVVICWNVGWLCYDEDPVDSYKEYMIKYGFNQEQIYYSFEHLYGELVQLRICEIASEKKSTIHFIDRCGQAITEKNDSYYCDFKNEFHYSNIEYKNKTTRTLSSKGIELIRNAVNYKNVDIEIYLISVLIE